MGEEGWKIRRTDDSDICFVSHPVHLWANGVVEFRVDRRNDKCLVTPIMRDKTEGAVLDLTESLERSRRERQQNVHEQFSYDPILLKKIMQIYADVDDLFLVAFERAVGMALKGWLPTEEEPQFMALADEFGRDTMQAALRDARQLRLEFFEKAFDLALTLIRDRANSFREAR